MNDQMQAMSICFTKRDFNRGKSLFLKKNLICLFNFLLACKWEEKKTAQTRKKRQATIVAGFVMDAIEVVEEWHLEKKLDKAISVS